MNSIEALFRFIVVVSLIYFFTHMSNSQNEITPTAVSPQHEEKYEIVQDWAEDSTVSESRKEYYEYVYTKEIEDYKRKGLN